MTGSVGFPGIPVQLDHFDSCIPRIDRLRETSYITDIGSSPVVVWVHFRRGELQDCVGSLLNGHGIGQVHADKGLTIVSLQFFSV